MIRIPKNRPSTHPGEMLRDEFLVPFALTQAQLAREIKVPFQRVNEIIAGKRGLTPSTSLRLAKFFRHVVRLLAKSANGPRPPNGPTKGSGCFENDKKGQITGTGKIDFDKLCSILTASEPRKV